ncbi:MAG: U32 family peptidase [Acholeplasmatales bacterium]|jgi:putative protease|nr:U32 family peptidase [Acholeplasmatales bacterium]
MNKIELLSPAGDLERLKVSILYGADAIYLGGMNFSLRKRASNFSINDIKEGVSFAHSQHKKVYVTMNMVPFEKDLLNLNEYIKELEEIKVDGVIVSSLGLIYKIKKISNLEIHYSTQGSSSNSRSINFLKKIGVSRVVLARELTLDEVREVAEKSSLELEVFIHGGMCMSYSGRCSLSNSFCLRDANRGGCAHSCRWLYSLCSEDDKVINPEFSLESKDLCALESIKDLMSLNISSLKIEGRMKSAHYIASIVSFYNTLIKDIQNGTVKTNSTYYDLVDKGENRQYWRGFLKENDLSKSLVFDKKDTPNQIFVGIVRSYNETLKLVQIETRNYFKINSYSEFLTPTGMVSFYLDKIYDSEMNEITESRHPNKIVYIRCDEKIPPFSFLRVLKNE